MRNLVYKIAGMNISLDKVAVISDFGERYMKWQQGPFFLVYLTGGDQPIDLIFDIRRDEECRRWVEKKTYKYHLDGLVKNDGSEVYDDFSNPSDQWVDAKDTKYLSRVRKEYDDFFNTWSLWEQSKTTTNEIPQPK